MPDIFISYTRKDFSHAEQLSELLSSAGLSCWIDKQGIGAATSWSREIVQAINECKAFVVLLSNAALKSHNVLKEVSLASEKRKRIVPIHVEPVQLTEDFEYQLAGIQRTQISNIDAILSALGRIGLEATAAPTITIVKKPSDGRKSLMVLPFEDLSPTNDNEWFADGMASELIASLGHIKSLRVVDWSTTQLFKERKIKTTELARELEVRYFIEGQVRKFGEQLKISATLLDVETGDQLWHDSIKGTMAEVFDIQEQVAARVVEGLKLHLASEEKSMLTSRGTENPEAYELLLKSMEYSSRETKEDNIHSMLLLTEAIRLDPNFAEAIARKAFTLAEQYRAYDRHPQLLEEAEALTRHVMAIAPGMYRVYGTLSRICLLQGKLEAGETNAIKCAQMAPYSSGAQFDLGFFYMETNQPAKAIEPYQRAIAIRPDFIVAYFNLVMVLQSAGEPARAKEWALYALPYLERRLRLVPDDEMVRTWQAFLMFVGGLTEQARDGVRVLLARKSVDGLGLYNAACLQIRFGDFSDAMHTLARAWREGFANVKLYQSDPDLDPLRGLPEFQQLMLEVDATPNA